MRRASRHRGLSRRSGAVAKADLSISATSDTRSDRKICDLPEPQMCFLRLCTADRPDPPMHYRGSWWCSPTNVSSTSSEVNQIPRVITLDSPLTSRRDSNGTTRDRTSTRPETDHGALSYPWRLRPKPPHVSSSVISSPARGERSRNATFREPASRTWSHRPPLRTDQPNSGQFLREEVSSAVATLRYSDRTKYHRGSAATGIAYLVAGHFARTT